jgi:glycosyltransferase involved in cell wall biosynthesis
MLAARLDLPTSQRQTPSLAGRRLSVVVPCFNEEAVLPETTRRLGELLDNLIARGRINEASHVYFVDDGSLDQTWSMIEAATNAHAFVRGIKLSRNSGHQNALLAGLFSADGDAVITVDADLQDDLSAIELMVEAYLGGSDIVYGVRNRRAVDSFLKRFTAENYYRVLNWMGVQAIFNHADYRLMSRRAVDALRGFKEVNLFLRGIIPLLGYTTSTVYYERARRFAGESKFPLRKMLGFAWEGITSFSPMPLHFITTLGLLVSFGSFVVTLWALWVSLFTANAVPGWASTVLPIYFLGGIQLLCIGIIGEYLAKMYMETKERPRYLIEKTAGILGAGSREGETRRGSASL